MCFDLPTNCELVKTKPPFFMVVFVVVLIAAFLRVCFVCISMFHKQDESDLL